MELASNPQEKKIFWGIMIFSVVVFLLVVLLSMLPKAEAGSLPSFIAWLPRINAIFNGTASLILIASFNQIKKKNVEMHKRLNIGAFVLSSLFLVSYVWFHSFGIETTFPADNGLRPVYLFILITHIILAAGVLPLVLYTFYLGITMKVQRHRKLAKIAFPIWLYVTITGVIVYLMISPYYQF